MTPLICDRMLSFGTNGIRGLFSELGPKEAVEVAQKAVSYLGKRIVVGGDFRRTTPILKRAVISGLTAGGAVVFDVGTVPTPVIEFMTKWLGADGGIAITASHNPPEWNGIKICDNNGIPLSREDGARLLASSPALSGGGKVLPLPFSPYLKALSLCSQRKVVLDCGHGAAVRLAKKLFPNAIILNSNASGTFPGRHSEPKEEHLAVLKETVVEEGADCGIAWDGDCDRVVWVDEKGGFVRGDYVFALCIKWAGAKTVATTVATSRVVEEVAERVFYTPIGVPYIAKAVWEKRLDMGGEEVGGIIWPKFSNSKDGFIPLKFLDRALEEMPLSQWLASLPRYQAVKLKLFVGEKADEVVARAKAFAEENGARITAVDGVRADWKDRWFIVRKSGTEKGAVRLFVEGKRGEEVGAFAEKLKKLLLPGFEPGSTE